jgi:hypothetical protein
MTPSQPPATWLAEITSVICRTDEFSDETRHISSRKNQRSMLAINKCAAFVLERRTWVPAAKACLIKVEETCPFYRNQRSPDRCIYIASLPCVDDSVTLEIIVAVSCKPQPQDKTFRCERVANMVRALVNTSTSALTPTTTSFRACMILHTLAG